MSVLSVVALVGRANVGKSALFNRLTRSHDALVVDEPGVTRDRHYGFARSPAGRFIVIDTGGLAHDDPDIDAQAESQADAAIAEADVVLLVVDYQSGATVEDEVVATRLRRAGAAILVVVNKAEGIASGEAAAAFHALGLGAPWPISATHGDRIGALVAAIARVLPNVAPPADDGDPAIRLALLGRPNVGKSSLVNHLLGEARMLTQHQAGTTHDAIASRFTRQATDYAIIDTAGIRRRSKGGPALERLGFIKAMRALDAAEVALVMLDAETGLVSQDVRLLGLAVERGRGAVIVVNKWDRLDARGRRALHADLVARLNAFTYLPLCFTSAIDGNGVDTMLAAARASHAAAGVELSTAALSRTLADALAAHAPPVLGGRRIKLRYAHQGGRNPPRIVVHGNQADRVPTDYRRYLTRCFREAFDLFGTPIELVCKRGDNPYDRRRT